MEEALKIFYETLQYAQQLNDATQKAEEDLKDYKRLFESANDVSQKASRAQKKLQDLEQSLNEQKIVLKKELAEIYQSNAPNHTTPSDNNCLLQQLEKEKGILKELHSSLAEKEKKQREINFARNELKLQQAALPLHIGVDATRSSFKGFVRRSDGQVELIEYDLTKSDGVQIADELWSYS